MRERKGEEEEGGGRDDIPVGVEEEKGVRMYGSDVYRSCDETRALSPCRVSDVGCFGVVCGYFICPYYRTIYTRLLGYNVVRHIDRQVLYIDTSIHTFQTRINPSYLERHFPASTPPTSKEPSGQQGRHFASLRSCLYLCR